MTSAKPRLFQSFFQGGFECSTHRRRDGLRLDVIASTEHDRWAEQDYRTLSEMDIRTVRDGVRWHLIETHPHEYDFSSVLPMVRAARDAGVQVIWDLCHYGWPDSIDIFSPEFVSRFGRFARAFAALLLNETGQTAMFCPINEMSYFSWAGGEVGYLNPFARGRGSELKAQLVRASIAAIDAVRQVLPGAHLIICEPAIHIAPNPENPGDQLSAEYHRLLQFQALDMLSGRIQPSLGGKPEYIDVVGVNYYSNNQWLHHGRTLRIGDESHRPFRHILREFHARYARPCVVSETGIEDDRRPAWLAYVADEVMAAKQSGVQVEGICLYPIANHAGWDNDRHCHNGLLDYPDEHGRRETYHPLARELFAQQSRFRQGDYLRTASGGR